MHHTPPITRPRTCAELRQAIVGIDTHVPVLDGCMRPYVFLDNGASTPAFRNVLDAVTAFLPYYSGVHRGTGFKSLLATEVFDTAHDVVGHFVGADLSTNSVIFTRNTTEAANKLANRFGLQRDDVVITTLMEHHSNDLPWRKHATVIHTGILGDGHPDLQQLRALLKQYKGKVKLVAVTGASNITGICPPVHEIAAWAHEAGAQIFVDAAQLAPHRPIDMGPDGDPAHIDFLALSGHKMYAPFGTGALIGPRSFFEQGSPDAVGGGVVEIVTLDRAVWNRPPHKEEAGSPNVIGGVALAEAIAVLQSVGMENIAKHERGLLTYAIKKLKTIPGIILYGPTEDISDKVGVITFNVEGMHHALVAAILGAETAIGVRNGCFCAHPYVKELLRVTPAEDTTLTAEVLAGNKSRMPGMVRASLGCYNTADDIDALAEALTMVARRQFKGTYTQNRATGAYHAEGFSLAYGAFYPYLTIASTGRVPSEAS